PRSGSSPAPHLSRRFTRQGGLNAMLRFVGCDVHKRTAVFTLLLEDGTLFARYTVPVTREALSFRRATTRWGRPPGDGSHDKHLGGGRGVAAVCERGGHREPLARAGDCRSQDQNGQGGFAGARRTVALRLSAEGVATGPRDAAVAAADASAGGAGERPHTGEKSLALDFAPHPGTAAGGRSIQQERARLAKASAAGPGRSAGARQRLAVTGADRTGNRGTRRTAGARSLAG